MKPMMKCGHSANAHQFQRDGTSLPCCAICGCIEVDNDLPDLTGRVAKCSDCGKTRYSSSDLAFFKHKPKSEYDEYYCGCRGWD